MAEKKLRKDAGAILKAALDAVEPSGAVKRHLKRDGELLRCGDHTFNLDRFEKIIVIGAGKAGAPMAAAIEDILGDLIEGGIVSVKDRHVLPLRKITLLEASHPVPDSRGVRAAEQVAELVRNNRGSSTLFINLISGGASALLPLPARGISLEDKQKVTRLLLECGADINEINAVRKHLSAIKGGNLARLASGSVMITLVISDVIGDRLDTIGSGPAFPDTTTWKDVREILERYNLYEKVPEPVRSRIERGLKGEIPDTPDRQDPCFREVVTCIIASNRQALLSACDEARVLGYRPMLLSSMIQGETSVIARMHGAIAHEARESSNPLRPPCCIVSGGETTVTMGEEHGKGGRNQEFALAAALEIAGLEDVLILSAGTDGTDGPTDAAGAVVTGKSVDNGKKIGLDASLYLRRHDSYSFFSRSGELIVTGPTMTNVMDIHLIMLG